MSSFLGFILTFGGGIYPIDADMLKYFDDIIGKGWVLMLSVSCFFILLFS